MSSNTPSPAMAADRSRDPQYQRQAPGETAAAMLDSETLLQGRSSVTIRHQGVVYRLQTTKLGKLILTK